MKYYRFQSSIWATLLMFIMFFLSGFLGAGPAQSRPGTTQVVRPARISARTLQGRTVVIDPGHGGSDPGTIGVGRTTEADNVLAVAWELKALLEGAGAKVIMTRQSSHSPADGTAYAGQENGQLASRTALANRSSAHIFVSLHNDWSDNAGVSGSTTYYYKSQDWALAEAVQRGLVSQLGTVDRGVRHGDYYVLRNSSMPAALVEIGFLSNAREADLLSQRWYRLEAARGIFYGIVEYFQLMN
ncbi:MAG: N-acetylmuramoyl-L-alanine amidase [Firmicutes bacterium]|nr:N-acetylmuramoyl-L-alanine amidase [Bacillota bacterium]